MRRITDYLFEFQRYLEFRNYSKETMKAYRNQITRFTKDIGDLKVNQVRKLHLINWIIKLRQTAQNGYIINCCWAMRSFLKFLKKEKGLKVWCFEDLKIPKHKETNCIKYLTNIEVKKLLDFFACLPAGRQAEVESGKNIYPLRMKAYLTLLLNTGLRPSEALKLNRSDIRDEVEIIGKGRKERKVYLNDETQKILNKYLGYRIDDHPALFVTHCKTKRLAFSTIGELFRNGIKEMHIEKKITLHMMRRTYATNLLRHGCSLPYIQVLLGHSKIETTQRYYTAVIQEDTKKAQEKYLNYED